MNEGVSDYDLPESDCSGESDDAQYAVPVSDSDDESSSSTPWYDRRFAFIERPVPPWKKSPGNWDCTPPPGSRLSDPWESTDEKDAEEDTSDTRWNAECDERGMPGTRKRELWDKEHNT